mgnify:CR=1 FL=1
MIEFEFEGKKYVFEGEYHKPTHNEAFLSDKGEVWVNDGPHLWPNERAIVKLASIPQPKTVEFGGIVWRLGETRCVVRGDWYYVPDEQYVLHWGYPYTSLYEFVVAYPVGIAQEVLADDLPF